MSSLTWPLSRKMLANLNQQERQLLADKLMDLANLVRGFVFLVDYYLERGTLMPFHLSLLELTLLGGILFALALMVLTRNSKRS